MLVRLTVAGLLASASIAAVAPNPTTDGDRGEFVAVTFDEPTDTSGWVLADGENAARLPNRTLSGTVALSLHPAPVRNRTSHPVVELDGDLSLSNGGEWVALRAGGVGGRTVANVTYPDSSEAEKWTGDEWVPLGATDFRPFVARNVDATTFVLPDAPGPPLSVVESADERLYLAGYTFTSRRVTGALVAAETRGVNVRVLVDGSPVGGLPNAQAARLDTLAAAGVDVRVLEGERARYSFHHAKYAVADDRAVVLSENWKPAGTGGHGSRGWGVTVRDAAVADHVASVFRADTSWADAVPWQRVQGSAETVESSPADASFPTRFHTRSVEADSVRVLVAPDHARREVRDLVASADESLLVEQVSIDPESAFLNWTVDAARRGVRVRVLLSGTWYVWEENRNVTERLNAVAARENLDLSAKLVSPRSRFAKVHVKGAIVDGERALVGSLNWNEHSATENRELVVVVEGERAARFYRRAFRADWRGGAWRLPVGLAAAVSTAALLGAGCGWRIEFDGGESDAVESFDGGESGGAE